MPRRWKALLALVGGVLLGLVLASIEMQPSADPSTRVLARWIAWFVALLGEAIVVALYLFWLFVRRHIWQTQVAPSPNAMSPNGRAHQECQQLASVGFRYLGELDYRSRLGALHGWVWLDTSAPIRATVYDRGNTSFDSLWSDAAFLATTNRGRMRIDAPRLRIQAADGLLDAYRLHLATAPVFGQGHGDAISFSSIQQVAQLEQQEQEFMKEAVPSRPRPWFHLLFLGGIVLLAVTAVIPAWPF